MRERERERDRERESERLRERNGERVRERERERVLFCIDTKDALPQGKVMMQTLKYYVQLSFVGTIFKISSDYTCIYRSSCYTLN